MNADTEPQAVQTLKIDWIAKLQHFLQTIAFCLAIAAIQFAIRPERPYEIPLVYSLAIGTLTWASIDFGRLLFAGRDNKGWPTGLLGIVFPACGIVLGYLGGTVLADAWFGWSSWSASGLAQLRVSLVITLLAGLTGTYYFYTRGRSAWLQTRITEAHAQATEAKLKLLEAQLEPHMVFNTLANLRVLIATDPPRAQAMLDHLIAYLRATLGATRATLHPLADEFARLADYLEIMAVRMGPRLAFTLDLPESLRNAAVPPLLLQPLVENAIRHGLEPQVSGGHIGVRAGTLPGPSGTLLVLEVVDTGVGPGEAPAHGIVSPGSHFGLAQVRERLTALYGAQGTIELIAGSAGETSARATFPLNFPNP
ncbi:MAG: sensor histidine kinase [Giesbergeria sp.]